MATQVEKKEKPWQELTPDEKLQKRIDAWLAAPGLEFVSPQAETDYKARINRFLDAVTLRKTPDRVPVMPGLGGFAEHYYGYTQKDMMYDPDKANEVSMKATLEFQIDTQIGVGDRVGRVLDILDNKNNRWPGHGVPDDGETQFLEAENLKADEYDAFMRDPTDFGWRVIAPRTLRALEPFAKLSAASHRGPNVADFGRPEIQAAFMKLIEAGKAQVAFQQKTAAGTKKLKELGYPVMEGGSTGAPFDSIGDSLRGTAGICEDMFSRPEKLMEALEWFTSRNLERGVAAAKMGNAPVIAFHLHKGSDTYMSDEQFRTFYWPSLRKVMLGLVNEGLIVSGGNQGFHNKRLEYYRDVPKGRVFWSVGYGTDIARAKEVLGGVCCIRGGITADILQHETPEDVDKRVRNVMDIAKKGGGYIFSTSNMDRNAKVENVKAMIAAAKKYGVYR